MTMINQTAQVESTPNTNPNSESPQSEPSEITVAKARVAEDEVASDRANKWLLRILVLYGVLSLVVAAVSVWTYTASSRLRRSDNILSTLHQERAAKAEKELEETRSGLSRLVLSSMPQWAKFVRSMKDTQPFLESSPKGTVDIVYRQDSVNGFRLGFTIGLDLHSAGWRLLSDENKGEEIRKFEPRAVPSVMELLPPLAKLNWSDMVVLSREGLTQSPIDKPPNTAAETLWRFLTGVEIPAQIAADPRLPEGVVRLVITVP